MPGVTLCMPGVTLCMPGVTLCMPGVTHTQMNVRQLKAGLRLVGSLSQLGRSVTKALVVSMDGMLTIMLCNLLI